MNLITALEETKQYVSGSAEEPGVIAEEDVARKNADSLAQLDKMMRGVQR